MSSSVFAIARALDEHRVAFTLHRNRPDTIQFQVAFVGARWEIDVFEDDHVEISRFHGDESVEGGVELLMQRLRSGEGA